MNIILEDGGEYIPANMDVFSNRNLSDALKRVEKSLMTKPINLVVNNHYAVSREYVGLSSYLKALSDSHQIPS